jgi:hypothetical protein|tara:strand:+ start:321 stop:551 length:231 start_codon:yes stop_codon:yes gene_type:complete
MSDKSVGYILWSVIYYIFLLAALSSCILGIVLAIMYADGWREIVAFVLGGWIIGGVLLEIGHIIGIATKVSIRSKR